MSVAPPSQTEPSNSRSPPRKPADGAGGEGEDASNDSDADERPTKLYLTQDADIDPGPSALRPYALALLVDPKNLPALTDMSGIAGVLRALGTHRTKGLNARALQPDHAHPVGHHQHLARSTDLLRASDGRPGTGTPQLGAGQGASQRHDRLKPDAEAVPEILVTNDDGEQGTAELEEPYDDREDDKLEDSPAYNASLEERRRVFGENVLPTRKTKSSLQLMWLALKDKVLVSIKSTQISREACIRLRVPRITPVA